MRWQNKAYISQSVLTLGLRHSIVFGKTSPGYHDSRFSAPPKFSVNNHEGGFSDNPSLLNDGLNIWRGSCMKPSLTKEPSDKNPASYRVGTGVYSENQVTDIPFDPSGRPQPTPKGLWERRKGEGGVAEPPSIQLRGVFRGIPYLLPTPPPTYLPSEAFLQSNFHKRKRPSEEGGCSPPPARPRVGGREVVKVTPSFFWGMFSLVPIQPCPPPSLRPSQGVGTEGDLVTAGEVCAAAAADEEGVARDQHPGRRLHRRALGTRKDGNTLHNERNIK